MKLLVGLFFAAAIVSHAAHTYFQGIVDSFFTVFKFCFFTLLLITVLDSPERLRWICDPAQFDFGSTAELPQIQGLLKALRQELSEEQVVALLDRMTRSPGVNEVRHIA